MCENKEMIEFGAFLVIKVLLLKDSYIIFLSWKINKTVPKKQFRHVSYSGNVFSNLSMQYFLQRLARHIGILLFFLYI